MKRAALLDVDHTLVFADPADPMRSILNDAFLDRLKAASIQDVYLFTDMTLKPRRLQDREWLIEELEKRGFHVHGVVCPADIAWGLEEEELSALEAKINTARAEKTMRQMTDQERHDACRPLFNDATTTLINAAAGAYTMGDAYQTTAQAFRKTLDSSADLTDPCLLEGYEVSDELKHARAKSEQCKFIADAYADAQFPGCGVKGLMYEKLAQALIKKGFEEIVFADDKETELRSAAIIHAERFAASRLRLSTILIAKDNKLGRRIEYDKAKSCLIAGSTLTGIGAVSLTASLVTLAFMSPAATQAISALSMTWPIALAVLGVGLVTMGVYIGVKCYRSRFFKKQKQSATRVLGNGNTH